MNHDSHAHYFPASFFDQLFEFGQRTPTSQDIVYQKNFLAGADFQKLPEAQ